MLMGPGEQGRRLERIEAQRRVTRPEGWVREGKADDTKESGSQRSSRADTDNCSSRMEYDN